MRDIGKNIKQLRQAKNLTQDVLAEKLFVTRQTVSNYETGKSRPDIEMLMRIAEVLDTDLNTVLYGPVQQTGRKQMLQRFFVSFAILLLVWTVFVRLSAWAAELANTHYIMGPSISCVVLGIPLVAFLFGWTAMQALGTFAKLSPFADPWSKRLRWTVLGTSAGYLLLQMPIIITFILQSNWYAHLPNTLWNVWSSAAMWLAGYSHGVVLRPHLLLFGLLGCGLWLGMPRKQP